MIPKSYEIIKLADAKAKEIKIISSAIKNSYHLTAGIKYEKQGISISSPKQDESIDNSAVIIPSSIEKRTENRLNYKESERQLNIESVTAFAAEDLKKEKQVTEEPVDEDWVTRFFNIAKDISNEEMQSLWGRILAGEIKKPKTYSFKNS